MEIKQHEIDILPSTPKECRFSEYVAMTSRYKCAFRNGLFNRCLLDTGIHCPYLKIRESER